MKRSIIIALTITTAVKLLLAWFTVGTSDVATWKSFADNCALCGSCVYDLAGPYGDPFNHPPFIILFLKSIANLAPFPFWFRFPSIVADIGTVVLVTRLLPNASRWLFIMLALSPVAILISGFHGNTDPIMILFVVASVYAASRNRWAIAGVLFGMALNIKIVPLMLVPCFLFYPISIKERFKFFAVAAIMFLVTTLPFINDVRTIAVSVFGYNGLYVNWGPAHYLNLTGRFPVHVLDAPMRYAILVGSFVLSWWFNRNRRSLLETCGAVVLLFYVLTPTIGMQYFAWGVPFVVLLGIARASLYYGLAGSLIALQYHRWSHGLWYLADSHSVPRVTAQTEFLSFVVWVACGFLLWQLTTADPEMVKRSRTLYSGNFGSLPDSLATGRDRKQ